MFGGQLSFHFVLHSVTVKPLRPRYQFILNEKGEIVRDKRRPPVIHQTNSEELYLSICLYIHLPILNNKSHNQISGYVSPYLVLAFGNSSSRCQK